MKVLKKVETKGWSYKHTCANCDSELEAEGGDLKYDYYPGDFRDPSYESFHCTCPECGQQFTVPTNKIPKLLQLAAKARKA